jgi:hypothetical protein
MEKPVKERKPMTPEQLEVLKARLMKARDAKLARVNGAVKDQVKQIPITKVVNEIVKELPFDKPLPKKRIPKPKPVKQPDIIPFEEELPKPKPKQSDPIDIPQKKDKNRFCKIVYYSEPSKKTLKKLNKIQDSSSSESESSDEEPERQQPITIRQPVNNEDEYYKSLARKFYS